MHRLIEKHENFDMKIFLKIMKWFCLLMLCNNMLIVYWFNIWKNIYIAKNYIFLLHTYFIYANIKNKYLYL